MSKPLTSDPAPPTPETGYGEIHAPFTSATPNNMTVKQRIEKALTIMRDKEQNNKLVLYGKHGVGKTWMARKLGDLTVTTFNITIWIFLNRKYERIDLFENIAWQLSLFPATEESEIDGEDIEINGDAAKKKPEESAEERLSKLEQALTFLSKKKCLIILDGGDKEREDGVMAHLKFLWVDSRKYSPWILATRLERGDQDETDGCSYFHVEPLPEPDAVSLLRERAKMTVSNRLEESILKTSGGIPSAVIAVVESMNHVVNSAPGFWTPESAFEELTCHMGGSSFLEADERVMELLCLGYNKAESNPHGNAVSRCSRHCVDFFCTRYEVNYADLITNWIMEGFFDPVDRLEEAYEQGHRVLMTLIDGGFLKKQEDNVLAMEGANLGKLSDRGRLGFDGEANLGLSTLEQVSIGRVIQMEGTIRTYLGARKLGKVSTLLADGTRLSKEVSNSFFNNMQELKILALFNPRFESLPVSVFETDRVLLLAFRGSTLLEKSYHLQKLKSLIVLEISGSRKLRRIPDDLFEQMSGLHTLNLSSSPITSLPPSLSKLSELRWLVLRACSRLITLESLEALASLEALILSGCSSFTRFSDRVFPDTLVKLRIIDLSYTPIQRLPFFHKLPSLRRLVLRGCGSLHMIPRLESLLALQVIDARGAAKVRQLMDESFLNQKGLRILDLSETEVSRIPSDIGRVSELYLSGCRRIEKLQRSEPMRSLEILDLEDVPALAEIEDGFFDRLACLGQLIVSKARLVALPALSGLGNLHRLSIRDCVGLESLPLASALERLEVLDVSGCSRLKLAKFESFEKMSRLKTLNLSETRLESLPRLPNPSNLRELLLRSCRDLRESPLLKNLEKLEVLDLSGCTELELGIDESFGAMSRLETLNLSRTRVSLLPPLPNPSNLRRLLLGNCAKLTKVPGLDSQHSIKELDLSATNVQELSSEIGVDFLKHISQLQILNLSKTSIKQLPPSIAGLKELKELVLSRCSELEYVDQELPDSIEVLDLSETKIKALPSLPRLAALRKLLATGCRELDFSTVEPNGRLEVLGLFGTGTKRFPYKVTGATRLRRLDLPSLQAMEAVDWSKVNRLPDQLNWEQCGLIKEISITPETLSFPAESRVLPEAYLRQFNVYLRGDEEEEGMDEVYSLVKHLPREFLEIRGPHGISENKTDSKAMLRTILREAESVSLVDLAGTNPLSELGDPNVVAAMKSCHLERCIEMERLPEFKTGIELETLYVSNLPKLQRGLIGFEKLQHLYLDCCPKLRHVFLPSEVPPELETLRVKFCDQLETIFKDETEENLCVFMKLKVLYLLELPELKRIGSELPKACDRRIRECPRLVFDRELASN